MALDIEYVRLGKSGLRVPQVLVGCMSFGAKNWTVDKAPDSSGWVLDEDESMPVLKACYDVGLRAFDTANVYSNGESELILGRFLKKYDIPRKKVTIFSKVYNTLSDDHPARLQPNSHLTAEYANQGGLSRKHIFDAVDDSCNRLGTYIDVLQIHRLDRDVEMEEIMEALNDVIKSGKVRYIGASNLWTWEFVMMNAIAEKHGWAKFITMQAYHSLLYREEEREMMSYCKAVGIGLVPWSPIARGALTRPWASQSDSVRAQSDALFKNFYTKTQFEQDKVIINRVEEVAKKLGVSMAQVAIAWSIKQGNCPIIGLNSVKRVDEAAAATKLKLSDEDCQYLEEPYQPKAVVGLTSRR